MSKSTAIALSTFLVGAQASASVPACTLNTLKAVNMKRFEVGFRKSFCPSAKRCDARWANFRELASRTFADGRIANVGTAAYMFATAWGETNSLDLAPGSERKPKIPTLRYWRLDHGQTYQGRGWVQLTWKYKYQLASKRTGYDLVGNPELASKPAQAYELLYRALTDGWLEVYRSVPSGALPTDNSVKLSDLVSANTVDYDRARTVINANCKKRIVVELIRTGRNAGKLQSRKVCVVADEAIGPGYLPPASNVDRGVEIGERARRFEQMICDAAKT